MLRSLLIENVALIERAEVEFSDGLNVLSGETGAGKSVILDCIDFVLGAKADKTMVRYGAQACSVSAEFSCDNVDDVLEELGIEADGTVVITRKLTADGKGTLRLNGSPVTVAMLRRVTSRLVDVHGQSEHFFLLKESNQLRMLDSVAGEPVRRAKENVASLLSRRKEILSDLKKLGGDEGERDRRMDILRYQIDEIERANLEEGEEEKLVSEREKLRNAEKIARGLGEARDALLSDGCAVDLLRAAAHALQPIAKFSDELAALHNRLEDAEAELSDLGETASDMADGTVADERELDRVEQRLDELRSLKKKYGGSIAAVLEYLTKAKEEYDLLSDCGEQYIRLNEELSILDDKLFSSCVALTKERKAAASVFTKRVTEELRTLNITSAQFEVRFEEYSREDVPHATGEGLDNLCFLFSANKGEPLKELGKIISGGEMSRFMLAIKAQLSSLGEIGTYLFDEIDAGIGGRTARVVAEKFCKIARSGVQVIAVSHLAQVSAFADSAFLIEKTEKEGRAVSSIRPLDKQERILEIARLTGGTASEHALGHAEELLTEAETFKKSL